MSDDYRNRRVLVVGLGRSGIAACRLLTALGAEVVGNDRRHRDELERDVGGLDVTLVLGSHPVELVHDVDLLVTSPGVPRDLPLLVEAGERGVPVWSEIELGFRQVTGTIVAVTGTKGKSTTATLVYEMLRAGGRDARLAGNIGAPLTAHVDGASLETVFVLEVSSFQLEGIEQFRPDVAVLLDVSPDHLDWHPSFAAYVRAKTRIFENQRPEDWAVVFGGNPLTVDMARRGQSRKLYFDLDCLGEVYPHVHKEGPWIVWHENGETTSLASLAELSVPGRHNLVNAMAASAAATLAGVAGDAIGEAIQQFEGLPHALERVAEIGGVRFYNDSKATNVQAVRAALESFESPLVVILGGRFKGGDFRGLRAVARGRVKHVLAIGESKEMVLQALGDVLPVERCDDLESAVLRAYAVAVAGDVVLLSPAGSSFDMFRDYQERGERFRQLVRDLERGTER